MEFGALLKTFIYIIASSLLYPVLFILVLMVLGIIIQAGGFFAEWLERARLEKHPPQALPGLIRDGRYQGVVAHRVTQFIDPLQHIIRTQGPEAEVEIENLIQDHTITVWRAMDRLRMLVRLAPGLGLIGTLIPMGTGLAALGQGDMTKLSSDLVIAFTTTVVVLAIGMASFFFYTVKRRWVEEDIKNIQVAAEILSAKSQEQSPCDTCKINVVAHPATATKHSPTTIP